MHYEFESADHIDDYLKAINGVEEFIVKKDLEHGYQVINYIFNTPTTFPDVRNLTGEERRNAILRRDCRGLKFDMNGNIIAKPYHKFFNVNQLPESQSNTIDWSQPHIILEKLDGSMITLWKNDNLYQTHTKMGVTDVAKPVSQFLEWHKNYLKMYEEMREEGLTGIFEWCSRQQRIVIDYPTDQLILTAIRENESGKYRSYDFIQSIGQLYNVPVVKALLGSAKNIQEFIDTTKELEDAEGYVIRFDNGHMCKIKGLWYMRIHNTKELFLFEKNVWTLILNNELDDVKPFMSDKDKNLIDEFAYEMEKRIMEKSLMMADFIHSAKQKVSDKKSFALEIVSTLQKAERALAFKLWDGYDPKILVREYLAKHSNTQKNVNEVREFLNGLDWKNYYYNASD